MSATDKLRHLNRVWYTLDWPTRIKRLNAVIYELGDAKMRAFVVNKIFRPAGVRSYDFEGQARAIHAYAVDHIYSVDERGEYLAPPFETIQTKVGDCDDMTIFIGAASVSVGLDQRVVLASSHPDRYGKFWTSTTGLDLPGPVGHVYCEIGTPALCEFDAEGNQKCKVLYRSADGTKDKHTFGAVTRLGQQDGKGVEKGKVSWWYGLLLLFVAWFVYRALRDFSRADGDEMNLWVDGLGN